MSKLKILIAGIFGVVAVMVLTALIHLIAAYVAVLTVLGLFTWFSMKVLPPEQPRGEGSDKSE